MGFDDNLINDFINYSKVEGYQSTALSKLVAKYSGKVVPVAPADFWIKKAKSLNSANKLEELIKGILLFFNKNNLHTGGSVSPIRWLFEVYKDCYPQNEPVLCTWIVKNRNNQYEPFGTICSNNAKSWNEHLKQEADRRKVARESTNK